MQKASRLKPPYGTPLQWGHPLCRGLWICLLWNEGQRDASIDQKVRNLCRPGGDGTIPTTSAAHGPNGWTYYVPAMTGLGLTNLANTGGVRGVTIVPPPATKAGEGFTFETWINPTAFGDTFETILALNSASGIYMKSTGKVSWYFSATDHIVTTRALTTGRWTHLVTTWYPSGWVTTYLDGQVDYSAALAQGLLGFAPDSLFNDALSETFAGGMEFIRCWNRALGGDEVWQLYTDPYAMFQPTFDRMFTSTPLMPTVSGAGARLRDVRRVESQDKISG
jgi:hypothetical protein